MLNPVFHVCLTNEEIDGVETIVVDKNPPPDFVIVCFSQIGNYTLVCWTVGEGENGEYLYRDKTPIALANGSLRLYEGEEDYVGSVWNRIDSNAGRYGVSAHIAKALRSPENVTSLV